MRRLLPALLLACGTPPDDTPPDSDASDTLVETDTVDSDPPDTDPVDSDPVDTDPVTPCDLFLAPSDPGDALWFTTRGCWTVTIDHHTLTVTDPAGRNTVQHWGDPHENLNGKHIKDWLSDRRTLLLPDDLQITVHATGPHGLIQTVVIYDGPHTRVIDVNINEVAESLDDAAATTARERNEADGETARITVDLDEVMTYESVYTQGENEDGTPGPKEADAYPLGETGGSANPNRVNDFYDDPRLAHT